MICLSVIFIIILKLYFCFNPVGLSEIFPDFYSVILYHFVILMLIVSGSLLSWLWNTLDGLIMLYYLLIDSRYAEISSISAIEKFFIKIIVFHFLIGLACRSSKSFLIFAIFIEFSSFQIAAAPVFIFFFSMRVLFTI